MIDNLHPYLNPLTLISKRIRCSKNDDQIMISIFERYMHASYFSRETMLFVLVDALDGRPEQK